MWYLASPYTSPCPTIREVRYELAMSTLAELTRVGMVVFSPIVHSHPMAEAYNLPGDWEFWKRIDEHIIRRCDGIIVLMIDGWRESTGVQAEIEYAKAIGVEVRYLEYGTIDLLTESR